MSEYQPVSDLKVKVREYKDKEAGKMKGVWNTVGTLWSTPHGSSMFITLDSIPVQVFKDGKKVPFDGHINVFAREFTEDAENQGFSKREYKETDDINKIQTQKIAVDKGFDIDDKPIDISKIEF